jgi:hypothetical protein
MLSINVKFEVTTNWRRTCFTKNACIYSSSCSIIVPFATDRCSPKNGRTVVSRFKGAPILRQQPSPTNYAELIAGIRAGNPQAVTNFRHAFTSGIQLFITRESNELDVAARVEEVVMSIIEEIRQEHITSANLPSQILELLRRHIRLNKLNPQSAKDTSKHQSAMDASQVAVAKDLLNAIPEQEREALKRYYVYLESENDICSQLDLSIEQFRKLKLRFRTQFMNTSQPTRTSGRQKQGRQL